MNLTGITVGVLRVIGRRPCICTRSDLLHPVAMPIEWSMRMHAWAEPTSWGFPCVYDVRFTFQEQTMTLMEVAVTNVISCKCTDARKFQSRRFM